MKQEGMKPKLVEPNLSNKNDNIKRIDENRIGFFDKAVLFLLPPLIVFIFIFIFVFLLIKIIFN